MYEPRGHAAMSGAILQPPTRPDADYGVLFIEVSGCLPMCGHGTIGVATVLVETGMVPVTEPVTTIRLDTPAGLVVAEVAVDDGAARSVTLRNVPAFSWRSTRPSRCRGSATCATTWRTAATSTRSCRSSGWGCRSTGREKQAILDTGLAIMAAINEQHRPGIRRTRTSPAATTSTSPHPGPTRVHSRHAMAIHPGWFDRSPCGTGTCARMAQLHARGELGSATSSSTSHSSVRRSSGGCVGETDGRRPAGGRPDRHRPGLGHRHRPVHARPRRPVPRRGSCCERRRPWTRRRPPRPAAAPGLPEPSRGGDARASRGSRHRADAAGRGVLGAGARRPLPGLGDARTRGDARPRQGGAGRGRPQQGLPGDRAVRRRPRRDHRAPTADRGAHGGPARRCGARRRRSRRCVRSRSRSWRRAIAAT